MAKIVATLEKKKHRNDLWLDVDGVLWFWDIVLNDWYTLEPPHLMDGNPFDCGLGQPIRHRGFEVSPTETTPDSDDWPDGPYTRVVKGPR